ncbi:MAG: TPR end-of-group domain-containing protein [Pyrinomonadaceae bacterium]
MKRCPECRRDYYDDTLLYCLDDGNALLEGPASGRRETGDGSSENEPVTAILSELPVVAGGALSGEDQTRQFVQTTDQTAILHTGAEAEPQGNLGESPERQSLSAHRAAKPIGGRSKTIIAICVAVVLLVAGFFGYRSFNSADSGQINSIAVLPFENRSGKEDTDYLSDGLADSLIYRLSQLPNLKVSPTSSVMRYKGKETDVAQIAKELEVDAVMSGRLVQRGDDISISVQLIDSRTKKLIWAEQYDRKMADLLATQREIATAITQKLELKLAGDDAKGITKRYTDNNAAYQLYLNGRHHLAKRTKVDILKGIEYFQQAIKIDPDFALAFSSVAESYNVMPSHGYLSPAEVTPPARAAAERALAIDPSLTEAHTALASILSNVDWNWTEAEREYKRSLELGPDNSAAHLRYGQHLWAIGRVDESIAELSRAVELEPMSLTSSANLALVYLRAGKKTEALEVAKRIFDLEPGFVTGHLALGAAYNSSGMYDDAIRLSEDSLQTNPNSQWELWIGGYAYARSGRRPEAEEIIARFREIAKTQYCPSYYLASIYAALGQNDKAFVELERSLEQRDWWLARMKTDSSMDPLSPDPRYKDLLKRMNLPE